MQTIFTSFDKLSLDELDLETAEVLPSRNELSVIDCGVAKAVVAADCNYQQPCDYNYHCDNGNHYGNQDCDYNRHVDNGNHYGEYKHDNDCDYNYRDRDCD